MKTEENAVAIRPGDMLAILTKAATDPNTDVAKMAALWDLAERMQEKQAQIAFKDALARLQAKLPQFTKKGKVEVKGKIRSRYATYEDMDQVIRPMLADEGFAISFDEERTDKPNQRIFTATLSHRDGHSETKHKSMPFDSSDFRSPAQSEGSTVSYARRYLLKMHLNIVEQGEDTDGTDLTFVSDDQLRDIETGIADTKGNRDKFMQHFGVADLKELPANQYGEAMAMIEAKRRSMSK